MNVLILPEVLEYLDNLVYILFQKEYFSYLETSQRYIDDLVDDININLPISLHKPAPKHFEKYGKDLYYATFNTSNRTTWYAFFTKHRQDEDIIYLVRYISNNHVAGQFLNSD